MDGLFGVIMQIYAPAIPARACRCIAREESRKLSYQYIYAGCMEGDILGLKLEAAARVLDALASHPWRCLTGGGSQLGICRSVKIT